MMNLWWRFGDCRDISGWDASQSSFQGTRCPFWWLLGLQGMEPGEKESLVLAMCSIIANDVCCRRGQWEKWFWNRVLGEIPVVWSQLISVSLYSSSGPLSKARKKIHIYQEKIPTAMIRALKFQAEFTCASAPAHQSCSSLRQQFTPQASHLQSLLLPLTCSWSPPTSSVDSPSVLPESI